MIYWSVQDVAYLVLLYAIAVACVVLVLHPRVQDNLAQRVGLMTLGVSAVAEISAKVGMVLTTVPVQVMAWSFGFLVFITAVRRMSR